MIARIEVSGLGPHDRRVVDLDPRGMTVIEGPSEAGKSTLMDAVTLALWGEDRLGRKFGADRIREGAAGVDVAVTLANGSRMAREFSVTDKGARRHRRHFSGSAGETAPRTEKAWLDAIGTLGQRTGLLRQVMIPQQWQSLALGEGSGRPLRDMLLSATEGQLVELRDVVARLMTEADAELRDSDSVSAKDAAVRRAAARTAHSTAVGALDTATTVLHGLESRRVDAPTDEDVAAARDAIRDRALWDEWHHGETARQRMADSVDRWQARRDAAGERPAPVDPAEHAAAMSAIEACADAWDERDRSARAAADEAAIRLLAARRALDGLTRPIPLRRRDIASLDAAIAIISTRLGAITDSRGDMCPTCERPGWELGETGRQAIIAELTADLATAGAKRDAAVADNASAAASDAAFIAAWNADTERLTADVASCVSAAEDADRLVSAVAHDRDAALAPLRATVLGITVRDRAYREWRQVREELGDMPMVPDAAPAPQCDRVSDPMAHASHEIVAYSARAEGARAQLRAGIIEAHDLVESCTDRVHTTRDEADRLDALVTACRQAPTDALMMQLGALGDLGGVVTFQPAGEGGIAVLIDGRDWQLASDGRLVVADMLLRAGIRLALGIGWLPIFVDRAQDVGGQALPDIGGPVIVLRTTDGDWEVTA